MKAVPATEAKNRFGAVLDAAQREPIVIRRQDRDIAVVLSMADYQRLTAGIGAPFSHARAEHVAEAAPPYSADMTTTVSDKGHVRLPAELREMDRIDAGQEFTVERLDHGDYRLVRRAAGSHHGVVDWLLACPTKGYFVPIDSDSTDTL